MLAEAKNSPILYEEAAELFKKANAYATNESASLLALAHSSFCKALESGTEFEPLQVPVSAIDYHDFGDKEILEGARAAFMGDGDLRPK